MDHLYSVWNVTRQQWATTTNYSTEQEAERLIKVIKRQMRDEYEVRTRKFGSMREGLPGHSTGRLFILVLSRASITGNRTGEAG